MGGTFTQRGYILVAYDLLRLDTVIFRLVIVSLMYLLLYCIKVIIHVLFSNCPSDATELGFSKFLLLVMKREQGCIIIIILPSCYNLFNMSIRIGSHDIPIHIPE